MILTNEVEYEFAKEHGRKVANGRIHQYGQRIRRHLSCFTQVKGIKGIMISYLGLLAVGNINTVVLLWYCRI